MPKRRNKPGTQKVENRLFILCEGRPNKSEFYYYEDLIKDLNIPKHKVQVILVRTMKNTGRELVREAIKSKKIDSDIAWVAYDQDGYTLHPETFFWLHKNQLRSHSQQYVSSIGYCYILPIPPNNLLIVKVSSMS
jgi:hypothetical protein